MKFLSITGPKADIDRLTKTYLSKYEIHLESALSELTDVANLSPFLEINPYREYLTVIDSFYEQLDESEKTVPEPMDIETALATVNKIQEHARLLEEQKEKLQEEHAGMVDSLKIIRPFKDLDYDISTILNFKYIHYRFGRIEKQYLQKFEKYIYDNLDTLFIKCGEDEQYVYGVYFVPEHEAHKVHAVYSSMHFERIFVPDDYQGTAREAFETLDKRHRDIHAGLDANKAEYQHFLNSCASKIVSAKAALESCSRNFDIRKLAACTQGEANTFYILCGWMTERDALAFQQDIQNDDRIFCLMEDQHAPTNKKPPTKLKNPKLFQPFEMYVKMYGLPAYNEMDPTWFVALTYSFIFGAMFGDVGQGLVLFLGGILPEFFYNPFRKLWANTLDQTRPKIFFNSIYCSRKCLFKLLYGKLPTIFGIHFPHAFQGQYGADMGIRHCANYRDQITVILHCTFQNRIAIFSILICNSLNYTTQMFHVRLLC